MTSMINTNAFFRFFGIGQQLGRCKICPTSVRLYDLGVDFGFLHVAADAERNMQLGSGKDRVVDRHDPVRKSCC